MKASKNSPPVTINHSFVRKNAVALGLGAALIPAMGFAAALAPEEKPAYVKCVDEDVRAAKPGDTLSGMGAKKANELGNTARQENSSVGRPDNGEITAITDENRSLNNLPETGNITAGTEYRVGQICVKVVGGDTQYYPVPVARK